MHRDGNILISEYMLSISVSLTPIPGDNGPALDASIFNPSGISVVQVDGRKVLYISDQGNGAIRRVTLS